PEIPGFVAAMDAKVHGGEPWSPVGIALAMTEPNGPVEHGFFEEFLATVTDRLRAAMPVDGVYFCAHGAAITTEEDDPEGVLFERIRNIVGPDVPVVATCDLHANVSDRMVDTIDAFIGYRTNPHLDMRERGIEAAAALRELLAGAKTERVRLRLPIVPPTVTLLTAAGPYAEMIQLGQRKMSQAIMNVSVMGGFALADVAANPAARGRGNTMFLLRDCAEAGVENALCGIIYDPDLAAEAHQHGLNYLFEARFNRAETTRFSAPWAAPARIAALHDG